jgi:hypothetical protein
MNEQAIIVPGCSVDIIPLRTVYNRWYFTFDGAEYTKPATIEGIVYVSLTNVTPFVTTILTATVTRFLKVTSVWGSGYSSVKVMVSEKVMLETIRSLVL